MNVIFYIVLLVFLLLALLIIVGSYVIFCIAIKSASAKETVFGKEHAKEEVPKNNVEFPWLEQVTYVTVRSKDGLILSGYEYINNVSAKWIICIHGYSGNASNMAIYMDHFIRLGHNVLSVDLRGHGRSEGKYYGLGYLDQYDIAQWIDYTKQKSPHSQVILFGISMGGATALMSSAYASEEVSFVVTDSVPTDFMSMFTRILYGKLGFLTPLVIDIISLYCRIFAGYWLKDASPISIVSEIEVPTLFIHGQADGFVPVTMGNKLYDKCVAPKQKLIIENADHTGAVHINPELYWNTIEAFLTDQN
ncbi:MAG: alpha/beta hydrolase [Ruminococcaceae bacterium]|nr:alpha/beta hydrolase [Oscillospiraceae bacterium]